MTREELAHYVDTLLAVPRFKDYCPNGLQVEGRADIHTLITGVSASQALIDAAIAANADAILVHHGYFWKGEDSRVTGVRRQRLKSLLTHDISLFAYHLPLDAHPELGNNAQLAKRFGWLSSGTFGEQDIGWHGECPDLPSLSNLTQRVATQLKRPPLVIGDGAKTIRRIAWCSGGGDSYFEAAMTLGIDAFFSGEISEPAVHLARETGIAYIAAGHHATEKDGVKALGEHLAQQFGITCQFVDIDNPA